MTKKENYLLTARGGKGEYIPSFMGDLNGFNLPFMASPAGEVDMYGVLWTGNEAGHMPDDRFHAMTDIAQWRDTIHFPVLAELDWEGMKEAFLQRADPDKATSARIPTSLFLAPMNMMGWVEGLCAIYENPEELEAFISYMTDYAIETISYLDKYIKPDVYSTGDDIANATGPFISPEIWEGLYRPYFKRIVDAIHAVGGLAEFHNCGRCSWLIDECIDIGCDILQLPEPDEELLRAKEKYGSRLVITGGWDRHGEGSPPGASEEAVRRSVHTAVDTWGKDGGLIFWDGGIVGRSEDSMNKMRWVNDEFEKIRYY